MLWYRRSSAGARIKAMVSNPPLAAAVGIDTARLARRTFVFGVSTAGLAGALLAPLVRVEPYMASTTCSRRSSSSSSAVSGPSKERSSDRPPSAVPTRLSPPSSTRRRATSGCSRSPSGSSGSGPVGSTLRTSLAAFLGLALVPFVWSSFTAYELGLYLLYGMVGQGIALCWGRAGFLPLGQALFFGIGAYLAGAGLKSFGGESWLLVPVLVLAGACLAPALFAGAVGALVFHRQVGSGPYFSLITLALAMLGFQLANSLVEVTGGFNGMTGIPALAGIDPFEHLYFVIVAALAVSSAVVGYLLRSPFGQLLAAVAQNEERLQFFGFRTNRLKAAAFAVSAGVAGLAGALYAPHQGIVTPQAVGFLLSAELVIWTAVGGRANLAGPVLGAVAIGFLASGLRDSLLYWEVVVALVFVVVVLRWPEGFVGVLRPAARAIGRAGGPAVPRPERSITLPAPVEKPVPRLRFEAVDVTVGSVEILKGLSFEVDTKAIHCLIGPNGAGKTSALNALTGKLPLAAGDIRWAGRSLAGERVYGTAARGIGRKSQVPSIFPDLTIAQNVDVALWANRLRPVEQLSMSPFRWRSTLLGRLESRFPFLRDVGQPAGSLSVGERQMLDFALTMLAEPDLVLLDEPCAGLSVEETVRMTQAIAELTAEIGATGIIVEHDMQVVERLSDHVLVLDQGRLLASGTMDEIRGDPTVQAVYAGGSKG